MLPALAANLGVVSCAMAGLCSFATQPADFAEVIETAILDRLAAFAADFAEELWAVLSLYRLPAFGGLAGACLPFALILGHPVCSLKLALSLLSPK